jgi:hypothetical protein
MGKWGRKLAMAILVAMGVSLTPVLSAPAQASYSSYVISGGSGNTVTAGQSFVLSVSITCNTQMSLSASPYYPSMYYLVNSSPWLNGYYPTAPVLSNGNLTATFNVTLTAPSTPGSYSMYAYGRGDVCFGDSYNFTYSPTETLVVVSAPTVTAMNPAANSTSITTSPNIALTYNSAVTARSGNYYLKRYSDDVTIQTFDVSTLTVSGSQVVLGTVSSLSYNTKYYVTADAGVVQGAVSAVQSGAVNKASNLAFTTVARDLTPPTATTLTPLNGATGVSVSPLIRIRFSEAVALANSGTVEVRKVSDGSLAYSVPASSLDYANSSISFTVTTPLEYETAYFVSVSPGIVTDTSDDRNQFAGISSSATMAFTTMVRPDTISPSVVSAVSDAAGRTVTVLFDEALTTSGTVPLSSFQLSVASGSRTVSAIVISGSSAILTVNGRAFESGQAVTLSYNDPSSSNDSNALQDRVGNDVASFSQSVTNNSTWNGLSPSVQSVGGKTANGSYRLGSVIEIWVTFSEPVVVTGTPKLQLETGATDQEATYVSGSGTSSLLFQVTVGATATTNDLDYASTSALILNSGTIKNAAGENATLTLAAPNASGSLAANSQIRLDNTAAVMTLSATANSFSSNQISFVLQSDEVLDCSSISTSNGVDFVFGNFSTVSAVASSGNNCVITVQTNVATGSSAQFSLSPSVSFSVNDLAGNSTTTLSQTVTVTVTIAAPAPTPTPTVAPEPVSGYTSWTVTGGSSNWVRPGQSFQMVITLTCNETMSLNSSPYYPSMYYMVNSSPWLNGYVSTAPALSADRKTATWTVNLTAPTTPGNYEMYAYGRGTVCFGDGYNFKYSSREKLAIQANAPTSSSTVSPSVSPTASSTVSPSTSATTSSTSSPAAVGYSGWNLSVLSNGPVNPGEQIQLVVSITCTREMKLNGAPYYPSMYYYLNSQPRINGVYGRPVLSNGGKTATWTVGAIAPNSIGKFVFQAYGRDNPFGSTCFGDNYNFTYSSGTVVEIVKAVALSESATVSPVATVSPGYSSWRLSAQGDPSLTAGSQLKLNVTLTCNIAMASNRAPYFPSMYYLVNSPNRINGVYGSPTLSSDGKTATWTVTVPAPSAGSYTFVAYGRDNPTGGTCFGDNYNFAYSTVEALTIAAATQPTPSAAPTPSPAPSVTPTPTATATPSPSAEPTQTAAPTPTPSETQSAQETPSAPVNIEPPVMPNAVVVSGTKVQIQPSFLLSAVEALAETVPVGETAIVRFRIGTGDWQEATVEELRSDDSPLDLAASDATGDLEIQVISAITNEPLGVVSYDFDVTEQGVNLTIQSPETDNTPLIVGIAVTALLVFGFLFAFLRRRKQQEESPLTSA